MNTEQPSPPSGNPASGGPITRYALVRSAAHDVRAYLPDNYRILRAVGSECVIVGQDHADWTLDGYVLPRLATGLHIGEEIGEADANSWDGLVRLTSVEPEGFSVDAREYADNTAWAWVCLGVEIVWSTGRESLEGYSGLDDFAGFALRRFAKDLAVLLDGDLSSSSLATYFEKRSARVHTQGRHLS